MPVIDAGEIQLSYERRGSGPPLLLIMGMSGTALHWGDPLLERLREDFDVIVYDHRGVGQSTPLSGSVTIAQMAQDAAALLGALEIDSAHVMGVSMGGMIAQELALGHPELIRTLTLGCTYCGGQGSVLTQPEVMQRLSEAMMSGDRQRALRAGWEVNIGPALVGDDAAYERFLEVTGRYAVALPVIMAQLQACTAHDTRERLGEVTAPTLVIHGTEDLLLPVENGRLIASLIPGARLEIMEGVGHMFWWEQPERSAELARSHASAPA